jgi:hypothetical protein
MVKRYLKKFGRHIKGRYSEDPYATLVLYGLFLGVFFLIFAFRGLIGAIFLPEVGIDKNAPVVKTDTQTQATQTQETTYTVQKDDTIYSIGAKFAVAWTKIAEANSLDAPYDLKSGQELKIPAP